jgi:hypothetical protein
MKRRRSWLNSTNTKLIVTLLAAVGSAGAGIVTAFRTPSNDSMKMLVDRLDREADSRKKFEEETRKNVEEIKLSLVSVEQRQIDMIDSLTHQEESQRSQEVARRSQHESLAALIRSQNASRTIASVPAPSPPTRWDAMESVPPAASAAPTALPK